MLLGEEDERTRRIGDGQPMQNLSHRFQLRFVHHDGDQVQHTGAGLRGSMHGRLRVLDLVIVQAPAHPFQLFLDLVDVDHHLGAELGVAAHGRLHRRPSLSIRASAASGPQAPAA